MPAPARSNRTYRNVARIVRPTMRAMSVTDWRGAQHLPADGGFIAAANHVTELDPLTFAHFLWDHGYVPRILAKDSLFRVPVLGPVLRGTGQIPVSRGSANAGQSLQAGVRAVEAGECVAVFPEGTLTRDPDLWPMVGKTGVARLALATSAPVIPIGQWGAHRILAPYGKMLHPVPRKQVVVIAGPPVPLDDLRDRPVEAATLRAATDRIMAAITALVEQARGQSAPATRFDPRQRRDAGPSAS